MKNFIIKVFIFSILIFAICFGLSEIKFSDEFLINQTKDTAYEKVAWNLNMISNNKDKIEGSQVFFGSSYVLNGLNDSVLNDQDIKSINFAIKHNGNELSLYFLKRVLEHHPSEVIFLKGKIGFQKLHKLTPLLYTPSTLLSDGQSINFFFISYLFKRSKLALDYIFFNLKAMANSNLNFNKFGISYEETVLSEEEFYNLKNQNRLKLEHERFNIYKKNFLFDSELDDLSFINQLKGVKRYITFHFFTENNLLNNYVSQENFVNTAKELALNHNVKFSQLYMPVVTDVILEQSVGDEFFMPISSDADKIYSLRNYYFLNNPSYWTDYRHLSKKGSIIFTNNFIKQNLNK